METKELNYTEGQKQFLFNAQAGANIFLTGKAGTGKSFIVKEFIKDLEDKGIDYIAVAPTGIAAYNIGGATIHSTFRLQPFGVLEEKDVKRLYTTKKQVLQRADVILIDEISMLRPDLLDAMNWTFKKNGLRGLDRRQIIFIGDLKQLPAPMDNNTKSVLYNIYNGEEFTQAKIFKNLNVQTIDLTNVVRQDDQEFIDNLNIIREGGKSAYFRKFKTDHPKGIILAPHNMTVSEHNRAGLEALEGKIYKYNARLEGKAKSTDFNIEMEIIVKEGAKIMYLINNKESNLVNGTLGTFAMKEGEPYIEVNGIKFPLEPTKFTKTEYVIENVEGKEKLVLKEIGSITQMPIKLAYALTIHKSQGLTFDEITVDLTLPCFSKGQLYTALSRVRSPEGLSIISPRG